MNLQIETSDAGKLEEEGPGQSPDFKQLMQLYPEQHELFEAMPLCSDRIQDPLFNSPEIRKTAKRLSINHFKIESSINEEIKEERSSSSEKSQAALDPQLQQQFESPKFPASLNASRENQQMLKIFAASPDHHSPMKGGRFELSEASKHTVEKDEEEIGSHLRPARRTELVGNIAISSTAKLNPPDTLSQSSLKKAAHPGFTGQNITNLPTKISKVNITFGANLPLGNAPKSTDESHDRALSYGDNTYDSMGANSVLGGKSFMPGKNAANF